MLLLGLHRPRFVDCYENWAHNCDFEMRVNSQLKKPFMGWHIEEVFALPTRDRSVVYVPAPGWWVGWEQSVLLQMSLDPFPCIIPVLLFVLPRLTRHLYDGLWSRSFSFSRFFCSLPPLEMLFLCQRQPI